MYSETVIETLNLTSSIVFASVEVFDEHEIEIEFIAHAPQLLLMIQRHHSTVHEAVPEVP